MYQAALGGSGYSFWKDYQLDYRIGAAKKMVTDLEGRRSEYERLDALCNTEPGRTVSAKVCISTYDATLWISVEIAKLTDMGPFLALLAKAGHVMERDAYLGTTNADPYLRWYLRGMYIVGHLADGGACERVQVGEATVPVYEVRCK